MYAKNGVLNMTQLEENDKYQLQHEYGVIQYDYHFADDETMVDIKTFGNAGQYFAKRIERNNFNEW